MNKTTVQASSENNDTVRKLDVELKIVANEAPIQNVPFK
jgi:hypothetical protein